MTDLEIRRIALFPMAMEVLVLSSPWPDVAAPVVVQLVSALFAPPDGIVD